MTRSQWGKLTLSLLISSLFLIVGTVVLIDPFEIYHPATAFIPPILGDTQIYSNAGIAKSHDYDSIIIGSSMTENFTPSQLDHLLGGRFVKLCVNGASSFNHKQMMDMAFATHDVQTVLYGLDVESLTYFYRTPKTEMPTYLYDDSWMNDVQYWFNLSVLGKFIPKCLKTWGQQDPEQRDTIYTWGDLYPYGQEAALAWIPFDHEVFEQTPPDDTFTMSQQTLLNIEHNLLPFIEAHPETTFLVFYPPYSLAHWYKFYRSGSLGYHLNQKESVASVLLSYENVKIYDFQAEWSWITQLDYYIDSWHYAPSINDAIIEAISQDQNRITDVQQLRTHDDQLRAMVDQIVQAGTWPSSFDFPTP